MPRSCSICSHEKAGEIAKTIARGTSDRDVASRYGVDDSSVSRHRVNCLLAPRRVKTSGRDSSTGSDAKSPRFVSSAEDAARSDEGGRCSTCGLLASDPDPKALLSRAERLLWLAENIAAKAQRDDDARMVLQAIDRARPMLEQLLKVYGMLQPDGVPIIDQRQVHLTALIAGKSDEELELMLQGFIEDGRRELAG